MSEFCTASSEIGVLLVRCTEEVNYQRWLVVLLATSQRNNIFRLFPMWPSHALMKTRANCGLSLIVGSGRASITSRLDLVFDIIYSLDSTVFRSSQ